jgi:hypothetical protein
VGDELVKVNVFWQRIRPALRSSSWLNATPLLRTAVDTGIEVIPHEIVPLQIDLAIGGGR